MSIGPQQSANTPQRSPGENVSTNNSLNSDVERLSAEQNRRREGAEKWDTWNIRSVWIAGGSGILVAIAGICLAVCAIGVSRSSRALLIATNELDRAKDRKLQADLRAKDDHIAEVEGIAKAEAARIEGEARKEAARIEGEGKRQAAELDRQAQQLRAQNLETESRLEAEKRTRLELQRSLEPREIFAASVNGVSAFDRIKAKGITVSVETIADEEARRAGSNIAGALQAAGWTVGDLKVMFAANFSDGVTIWHRRYVGARTSESHNDKSESAAVLLTSLLLANDWKDVRVEWLDATASPRPQMGRPDIPMNAIVVRIGFKPNPYFRDQSFAVNPMYSYGDHLFEIRQMTTEIREQKKKLQEQIETMKPEFIKRQEESDRLFEDAMRQLDEFQRKEPKRPKLPE